MRHFDELDSTNRWLVEQAAAGAPAGLVCVAAHQTAGRGRLGRRWVAPPGASLLVSVLLRPHLPPERLPLVTVAMALAGADACETACGVRPQLKWPNDLQVGDRKIGGVLAETAPRGGVVVGLGVNCTWPDELPEEIAATATSLDRVAGRPVAPADVLVPLLATLDRRVASAAGPELAAEFRASSATLGLRVRAELPNGASLHGTAEDVDDLCRLAVVDDAGVRHRLDAADVVHLR